MQAVVAAVMVVRVAQVVAGREQLVLGAMEQLTQVVVVVVQI
jgi:hypothetical protein